MRSASVLNNEFYLRPCCIFALPSMVEPTARIRPFKAEDEKLAKFTIGKANMEGLTTANTKSEWIQRYLGLLDLIVDQPGCTL